MFFDVVSAYQNNDITEFEKILRTNRENIMEDPFIREHIEGMYSWFQVMYSYQCEWLDIQIKLIMDLVSSLLNICVCFSIFEPLGKW